MTIKPMFNGLGGADSQFPKLTEPAPTLTLNLNEILRILRQRMWLILLSIVVSLGIAMMLVANSTPLYTTGAQLLLGEQGQKNQTVGDLISASNFNDTIIEGELAILSSGRLLGRVVKKLNLQDDPEFNVRLQEKSWFEETKLWVRKQIRDLLRPAPPPRAQEGSAVERASRAQRQITGEIGGVINQVRKRVRTRQVGNAFVVAVRVTTTSPQKSAAIANTIVDEYVALRLETRYTSVQRLTAWLDTRLAELEEAVQAAENRVVDVQAEITTDPNTSDRLQQQLSQLTSRIVTARAELAEAEARYRQITNIVETRGPEAAAEVISSETLTRYRQDIAELRREEAALTARFGDDDRQVAQARISIAALEAEIEREAQRLIQEQANALAVAQAGLASLVESLRALELRSIERSKDMVRLRQANRVAEANRLIYEEFLNRFNESRELQNLQQADAEVISYATPNYNPTSPNVRVALALAAAAGAFFSLGIAFLMEMQRSGFTKAEEVQAWAHLPVFGAFSQTREMRGNRSGIDQSGALSSAELTFEARSLRDYLQFGSEEPINTVLVTSSVRDEGKSTTALLLAWAMSQSGRSCVLVDADMKQRKLSRALQNDDRPDLVSVLKGDAPLTAAVRQHPRGDFAILPTTTLIEDHSSLFGPERVPELMTQLRSTYDVVIVDTPPLLALSDALAFGRHVDLILFAIRWRTTPIETVLRSLRVLRAISLKNTASVFTFVNRRVEKRYQYPGYKGEPE